MIIDRRKTETASYHVGTSSDLFQLTVLTLFRGSVLNYREERVRKRCAASRIMVSVVLQSTQASVTEQP